MFLEILQNTEKNTCARVTFLIKLEASGLQLYLKRDCGTSVFLWILTDCKKTCSLSTASIINFYVVKHYTNLDWDFLRLNCFEIAYLLYHILTYRLALFPLFGIIEVKIDVSCEIWSVSRKSKLTSRLKDGKNVSSKKLQIKTNLDNATENILKY